jgi:Cysteine-rich CPXCG
MNLLESTGIRCPCCGEPIEVLIDCSLPIQSYIEDCQVCCRPITLRVTLDAAGMPSVSAACEDNC